MPQAAIAQFLVTYFGASASGALIAAQLVQTILINVALGALTKKLVRRPDVPPINVSIRGPIEYRRIVLGTRRVGGVFAFFDVSSTGGSKLDVLWYVIVVAGHQVSAITNIWMGNEFVSNADINAGAAGGGAVTAGKFAGKLSIYKHLGTGAQAADTNVDTAFATKWTSNHKLSGCAYIVVKMSRDDKVYDSGAPQNVTSLVDGALVYDPRADSTNGGSGTQRMANPSTWVFSRNPSLHARWFLTGGSVVNDQSTRMIKYGLKEPDARIVDSYFAAAATICDQVLSGGNVVPSGGSNKRYTCNVEVSCGETRGDILTKILASMAGAATTEHGQWRIWAGAYDAPIHALTQDDLYGAIEVQDTDTHDDRYNAVAATFIDDSKGYIEQTTPLRTDSGYETQDGGEQLPREITLDGVTEQYQAQRLAEIELRKSRMMRTVKLVGALNLLKIAKYENFTLTHTRWGWNQRIFKCLERQFEFNAEAGRVTITAKREDSGVWADMVTADYVTGTSATDVFTTELPDAPTNLVASRTNGGNSLTWSPPVSGSYFAIEVWASLDNNRTNAVLVGEVQGSGFFHQIALGGLRYYWIRARSAAGPYSDWEPTGSTNGASSNTESPGESEDSPRDFDAVGQVNGILFSWSLPTIGRMLGLIELFEYTSSTPFISATKVWEGYALGYFLSKSDTTTRYYWIRLTRGNQKSTPLPTVTGLAAQASSVTSALAGSAAPSSITKNAWPPPPDPKTITSGSVTVTATGGTPGYTYAWTWLSGGSGITINSATSATTTFDGTNAFNGTHKTGTARCTITDSLSATATVDVPVNLYWPSIA